MKATVNRACDVLFNRLLFNRSAEPGTPDLDSVLREIYVLYSDCALVSSEFEDLHKGL